MKTEKLEAMEARYLSIEDQLSDPSVIANQNKWRELSKEHAELSEIISKFREYKKVMQQCQDARDILGDNTMKDLHDLAKEDLKIGFIHIGDESDKGYTYNMVMGAREKKWNDWKRKFIFC